SVNTKFRFSEITSNPENLLEKLKNYNLNDKEKKEIANYYNSLGNLSKRLNDYRHHFLEEENKPAKGINIVISKEKQSAFCIEQGGASLLNNPYAIIATHNFNVQTTLHEVGHCLGAEDTEIPYTIMTADLDYGSSIIWNSKAKKTIRKNILLEEYIYLKL
ncbi:MAG: hypothetical protein KKF89_04440, partial [Nanoarchaeota archaeon]|nr:hypothetical protein [Nanoarchaeota archaeon]